MSKPERHAFITLVATDGYASGALVLAHALRDHGTTKELACLVTPAVADDVLAQLGKVFDHIIQVESLDSNAYENLLLLGRLELGITLTKIGLWRQEQFTKVVFLDADTLPLRNVDELFDRPEFSAAPDSGWPDCFNSGVFVAKPSESTYNGLLKIMKESGSFDGGDQGLLNTYFDGWSTSDPSHRLPFTYNTTPTAVYSYLPAYTAYHSNIAIIHFIGADKPWHWTKFSDGSLFPKGYATSSLVNLVQKWWSVWDKHYGNASPLRQSRYDIPLAGSAPQANDFSISRYLSVWGDQTASISDLPAARMPPLSDAARMTSGWSAPHDLSFFSDAPPVVEHHYQPPRQPEYHSSHSGGDYSFVNWNPAYEPPPHSTADPEFPNFSNYTSTWTNAWDRPFARHDVFTPHYKEPTVVENIPPPPKYDPSMPPQDEVQRVFPWESGNSRPSRVWIDEEEARIARETEAAAAAAAATATAADVSGRRDSGFNEQHRDDMRFVNTWDIIPSINNYITRRHDEDAEQERKARVTTVSTTTDVSVNDDSAMYAGDEVTTARQDISEERFATVLTLNDDGSHTPAPHTKQGNETFRPIATANDNGKAPESVATRSKSQMFAGTSGLSKSGPTPYTSAATTPTSELPPVQYSTAPQRRSTDHASDLDSYSVGWASDLNQQSSIDKASQHQRTDFDVTPSVTPPHESSVNAPISQTRRHFRMPSGRSEWNPNEALEDVRNASIVFGGLDGDLDSARREEGMTSTFDGGDNEEDLDALGLRIDQQTITVEETIIDTKAAPPNMVELIEVTSFEKSGEPTEEQYRTPGGIENTLDPRLGSLFMRRSSKEGTLPTLASLEQEKALGGGDTTIEATLSQGTTTVIHKFDEVDTSVTESKFVSGSETFNELRAKLEEVRDEQSTVPGEGGEEDFLSITSLTEVREAGGVEFVTNERVVESDDGRLTIDSSSISTRTVYRSFDDDDAEIGGRIIGSDSFVSASTTTKTVEFSRTIVHSAEEIEVETTGHYETTEIELYEE